MTFDLFFHLHLWANFISGSYLFFFILQTSIPAGDVDVPFLTHIYITHTKLPKWLENLLTNSEPDISFQECLVGLWPLTYFEVPTSLSINGWIFFWPISLTQTALFRSMCGILTFNLLVKYCISTFDFMFEGFLQNKVWKSKNTF